MVDTSAALMQRLGVAPAFLLLGQSSDALATGRNELLCEAAFAALDRDELTYRQVLELSVEDRKRLFESLTEVTTDSVTPDWLEEVVRYPWNGVFTSRLDDALVRKFDADWRRAVPAAAASRVRHPRSSSELKVWMLFGGIGLPDDEAPPLDALEYATKARMGIESLHQLSQGLLTPRGTLLIEGYGVDDWLRPDELYALCSALLPGQAHLFSATDELLQNEFVRASVEKGLLVPHRESLALTLSDAEAAGQLHRPVSYGASSARYIQLPDGPAEISRDLWNRIIGNARPVDDGLRQPYGTSSESLTYQRFREFLGASEGAPPWRGIASGYAFVRDFEREIERRIHADVRASNVPSPLIAAGQAATGKSTGLQSLALRLAGAAEVAVLHLSRRNDRVSFAAVDEYALWAEERGALCTVLLWDGMTDTDEYFSAHQYFRSRGRRVLVVGTTYVEPSRRSPRTVTAPARLSSGEVDQLRKWLQRFGLTAGEAQLNGTADSSFLAALYRLVPESRRGVQRGLTLELRSAEAGMDKLAANLSADQGARASAMAEAFSRAGVNIDKLLPSEHEEDPLHEVPFAARSSAEQLTAMVLVAGRYGLRIPLELPLRVLGRDGSTALVEILRRFDIVRWSEDESGDQYLGSRTALEAEILARADLGGPASEVEVLTSMLSALRVRSTGGGGPEVNFVVDLIARIGPGSQERNNYIPFYRSIVDALRELRETTGVTHPRLVLVEAHLTRESVQWSQGNQALNADERMALLKESQELLEDALAEGVTSLQSRMNLLVELAGALGAQAYELSMTEMKASPTELSQLAKRVVDIALEARALDPENYYPVDVIAWVTTRLAKQEAVGPDQRIDLIADALASLEAVDEATLSPSQRAKFDQRQIVFAQLTGDEALEAAHLESLKANGDPAAYYLLCRGLARLDGTTFDSSGASAALTILRDAPEPVRSDWRCARLLLDLFWLNHTGSRFMRGEREALPFDDRLWADALAIADSVATSSSFDLYRIDFLRGLALFHLGRYRAALDAFRELDQQTVTVSGRIIATYLASDSTGQPRKFTGQVRFVSPDNRRGKAWVNEIGVELPFIPYRFSGEPMERGAVVPDFHIAFNLRGPYIDPVRISQQVERR